MTLVKKEYKEYITTENNELKDCDGAPSGDELNPRSPPGGSGTEKPPRRQYIRFPLGIPPAETLTSDQNEPTDPKLARDTRDRHEPPRQIGKNGHQLDPRSIELERLIGCAYQASVFVSQEGVPFALLPGDTIHQSDVASLYSREFNTFLRERYYAQYRNFPKEAHIRIVCDLVDREASRRTRTVALRVARGKDEHARELGQPPTVRQVLALDLGRRSPAEADSILAIDANGWSVQHSRGFAFLRPRGYRPLPEPELAGPEALTELKHLLGVDDDDWLRILTWLVAAMLPEGPYPILVILSSDGSGRQTAKMLKSLLDPAASLFQPLPTNPNTLVRQATQTWVQAYDHVTSMPKQISATLCRLSTGRGFQSSGPWIPDHDQPGPPDRDHSSRR